MEQIFNPKRFIKYAVYKLTASQKSSILILAGSFAALFLFVFWLVADHAISNENEWVGLFFGTFVVAGLLLIGHAFPEFRRKKSAINFLMAPASTFEKFIFEGLLKIILFTFLFPFVFNIIGDLSISLAKYIWPYQSYSNLTYTGLKKFSNEDFFPIIPWLYVWGASIALAGASAFKKLPLIKTLIFITAVFGGIAGYFYLMIEKMHLENGIGYFFFEVLKMNKQEPPMSVFIIFLAISSLIAFGYAYFNLKEREE